MPAATFASLLGLMLLVGLVVTCPGVAVAIAAWGLVSVIVLLACVAVAARRR